MKTMVYRKRAVTWLIVLGSVLIVSCAPQRAVIDSTAMEKVFWPGPPERPRIVYLWTVSSWGSGNGRGFLEMFAGASDLDITEPRSSSRLSRPYGIYVDEEGVLFITDPGAYRLTIISPRNGEVRHILKAGGEDFLSPIGVVAYQGKVFVSDSLLRKVFIFDTAGKLIGMFEGGFERPTALALDAEKGFIYVSDTLAHRIYRYSAEGKRLGSIGRNGAEKGEFNFPTHLWVDEKGLLYVTDSMNFRVQVFSRDGAVEGMFGTLGDAYGNLEKPKGITTDGEGNIYVVDTIKDMVKIFNRQGNLLLFFGGQGQDYGQFWLPSGIFRRNNDMYVADTYNGRVQVFRYLRENK